MYRGDTGEGNPWHCHLKFEVDGIQLALLALLLGGAGGGELISWMVAPDWVF